MYVDGDACPVRDEVFRVARRLSLPVTVVSNGSRGVRLPDGVRRVIVEEGADAADDWIVEAIGPNDICVTADIPLAARCLAKKALSVSPRGHAWTEANIGGALAGREISRHMRETGMETRNAAFTGADRQRFLVALDAATAAAMRPAPPAFRIPPGGF
ncbi:YaiI/YqxD family protein [Pararoseomonas sp. SCSIO 73927]|uniref:YaiI/YqxD family protein n=1 Tax=Pararoseomonas sp. SCSIO 73927 TaxID=3114537 RepID=UPI0030D3DA0C